MMKAGYPVGYITAPVFMYEGGKKIIDNPSYSLSEKFQRMYQTL